MRCNLANTLRLLLALLCHIEFMQLLSGIFQRRKESIHHCYWGVGRWQDRFREVYHALFRYCWWLQR